jgi:hypothetical protein
MVVDYYFPQFAPCAVDPKLADGVGEIDFLVGSSGSGPILGSRCPLKICSGHVRVTSHVGSLQICLSQLSGFWHGYRKLSPPLLKYAKTNGNNNNIASHLISCLSEFMPSPLNLLYMYLTKKIKKLLL